MAVAIFTKYLGYTNTKSSRIKAYAAVDGNRAGRSVTLEWDQQYGAYRNHSIAAAKLAKQLNLPGTWCCADAGDMYVWVRTDHEDMILV